jgi:hypothetical protein
MLSDTGPALKFLLEAVDSIKGGTMTLVRSIASRKGLLGLLLTCAACTSLNGCLLLAAGAAGAAGGYVAGKADDDEPREVHIHENRTDTDEPPRSIDVD